MEFAEGSYSYCLKTQEAEDRSDVHARRSRRSLPLEDSVFAQEVGTQSVVVEKTRSLEAHQSDTWVIQADHAQSWVAQTRHNARGPEALFHSRTSVDMGMEAETWNRMMKRFPALLGDEVPGHGRRVDSWGSQQMRRDDD